MLYMRSKGISGTDNSIRNTVIIHPDCEERFLPLDSGSGVLRRADIALAGISKLRTEYRIVRSTRRYHVLFFTLSGSGIVETDSTIPLNEGSLCIIPAETAYDMRLNAKYWHVIWFHPLDSGRWAPLRGGLIHRPYRFGQEIASLMNMFVNDADNSGAECAALTAQLIIAYLDREACSGTYDAVRAALTSVWQTVDANLGRSWDSADIAACMGLSVRQFARLCRKYYGRPPMEIVTDLRVARAKELLRDSDTPLDAVALRVGYASAFILSAVFKRVTGTSPSQWRSGAGTR